MWIVLAIVALSAVGLVLLLLPRFTPRAPRWAEHLVPPRYRRRQGRRRGRPPTGARARDETAGDGRRRTRRGSTAPPAVAGVSGVNGATAIGPRSRFAGPAQGRVVALTRR